MSIGKNAGHLRQEARLARLRHCSRVRLTSSNFIEGQPCNTAWFSKNNKNRWSTLPAHPGIPKFLLMLRR